MQLNHECIRDILFYLEANTEDSRPLKLQDIQDGLRSTYSDKEVSYHLYELANGGFINEFTEHHESEYCNYWYTSVGPLTWKGHEYLDNIRNKPAWEKLKESGLASMSLDVAKDLVKEIVLSLAKQNLHLQ